MASPKWNKTKKLWVIQGQHNGVKKSFYSSEPGLKGKREVLEKYDNWIDFGGVTSVTVEKCVELYLKDIEARPVKPIVLGIFRKQVPWLSAPQNTKVIQKVIHLGIRKTPDRSQGNFFSQEVFQYGNQI